MSRTDLHAISTSWFPAAQCAKQFAGQNVGDAQGAAAATSNSMGATHLRDVTTWTKRRQPRSRMHASTVVLICR
jgi:hypothetical protein